MGVSDTMPVFLVLRLVGGIASAFVLMLASTIVLEHLAELRRDGLSAIHFAGVGSGIAVSAALVAAMLRAGQPWWTLWLASGALALCGLVATAALLPHHDGPAPVRGIERHAALDPRLKRMIAA
jgi:MFS family permease